MKTLTNITSPAVALLALVCFALSPQVRDVRAQCPEICSGFPTYLTALGDNALGQNTEGDYNTALGAEALASNTTGGGNVAVGDYTLSTNGSGYSNTAVGDSALTSNTGGNSNTAIGGGALFHNAGGSYNTAVGEDTLYFNTTGDYNVAVGFAALDLNSTGVANVAVGDGALLGNFIGSSNTAIGSNALYYTQADENTGVGWQAMYSFSSGSRNTAIGIQALRGDAVTPELSTGENNTASGARALYSDTTGSDNVAVGETALQNNTTGSRNIALGRGAGISLTTGTDNIDIGNRGIAGEASTIRIGKQGTQTATFVAGISGATVPAGVAVIVDSRGHLGTTTSSARYKNAVKPMDKASEAILALQPVTFHYKKEIDPDSTPQFGLVAEDVEKVNPNLVARDEEGKPYTVRYEAVNAMLLNEFLKEHRKVEELQKFVVKQQAINSEQQKQIAALTSQMQQVSEQLRANKLPPQLIVDN